VPEAEIDDQEREAKQREREAILRQCERFLHGHDPVRMRAALEALAAEAGEDEDPDNYGAGDLIASFEHKIAGLLGKEAAVFMPSGTMAQQIALRIWSERAGRTTVAFHPTCHLELHEEKGYQYLHGLRARLVGAPHRLLTLDDLREVAEPIAALLLELPQREIGGQLPGWNDLQAQVGWARERRAAVHMDGARLWEAAPYYERAYAEIAALFDTVYVSFYKGLGGFSGAALAGPADVIAEARVWQRRHGGNLRMLFPYVLAARAGLRERLERFPHYHQRALAVGRVLAAIPGILVKPDPPQTHMMHVYLRGNLERMGTEALAIAREDRVGLFWRLVPGEVPGYGKFELSIGDAADALGDDEIKAYFERIIAAGSHQEAPDVVATV
jgi:threonine aldolase